MPNQPENRHAAFLIELGAALSAQEGIDNELAEILKFHLLKTKPDDNCVENAKAAILELAEESAAYVPGDCHLGCNQREGGSLIKYAENTD
jgi:hypothetical protein